MGVGSKYINKTNNPLLHLSGASAVLRLERARQPRGKRMVVQRLPLRGSSARHIGFYIATGWWLGGGGWRVGCVFITVWMCVWMCVWDANMSSWIETQPVRIILTYSECLCLCTGYKCNKMRRLRFKCSCVYVCVVVFVAGSVSCDPVWNSKSDLWPEQVTAPVLVCRLTLSLWGH